MTLQYGEKVKIKYSRALLELGLCELVTRKATVEKPVLNSRGKLRGAFVIPASGRLKGEEWYIPIQSIECFSSIEQMRTLGIIKKTIM